ETVRAARSATVHIGLAAVFEAVAARGQPALAGAVVGAAGVAVVAGLVAVLHAVATARRGAGVVETYAAVTVGGAHAGQPHCARRAHAAAVEVALLAVQHAVAAQLLGVGLLRYRAASRGHTNHQSQSMKVSEYSFDHGVAST